MPEFATMIRTARKQSIGPVLLCLLFGSIAQADEVPTWVQVHVTFLYKRAGTIATAPVGQFTYTLDANLDEMMQRVAPVHAGERPSYVVSDEYARSFKLSGTSAFDAGVTQYDKNTGKTYHASAHLTAALGKAPDFAITDVQYNPALSDGYVIKLPIKIHLDGAVHSDYPRMPDVSENDAVLLWPAPLKNSSDEGLVSEGSLQLFSELSKRPSDPTIAMMYDVITAADSLPGQGGLKPPSMGGHTSGKDDGWTFAIHKEQPFDTQLGGHYTDSVSVEVKIVPTTLPIPAKQDQHANE